MHYPIKATQYSASSCDQRIRFLVLHYTAEPFARALQSLRYKLSAHYLVPDPKDSTYQDIHGNNQLEIFRLVHESDRAWHAGISGWEDRIHINDQSIGIEIVNLASYKEATGFDFPEYNNQQIDAVIQLCLSILKRYPDIRPTRIVGHADIAPGRKQDPGPAFPWYRLHQHGIGAWYQRSVKDKYLHLYQKHGLPDTAEVQHLLRTYGYAIKVSGIEDHYTLQCIQALQMHFRPQKYDGQLDLETAAILSALIERYF